MATYHVKYNELQSQAVSLQNMGKTLASLESRLNTIAKGMDGRDTSMAALKTQVMQCGKTVPALANKVSTSGTTLTGIVSTYKNAEEEKARALAALKAMLARIGVVGGILSGVNNDAGYKVPSDEKLNKMNVDELENVRRRISDERMKLLNEFFEFDEKINRLKEDLKKYGMSDEEIAAIVGGVLGLGGIALTSTPGPGTPNLLDLLSGDVNRKTKDYLKADIKNTENDINKLEEIKNKKEDVIASMSSKLTEITNYQNTPQNPLGENARITSVYESLRIRDGKQYLHAGVDIVGSNEIKPIKCGTVLYVHTDGKEGGNYTANSGYGREVVVQHEDGSISIYSHCDSTISKDMTGEFILKDNTLGIVGSTGGDYPAHLHLEIYNGIPGPPDPPNRSTYGTRINPTTMVDF